MVFSSLSFLFAFLPLFLLLYFCAPKSLKNGVIFACSLLFYAWGEPIYVLLMLFSTVVDYINGAIVAKNRGNIKAKIALVASVIINLSLLGVFKYADFIVLNINSLLGLSLPLPELALPIGISFYTFQTMSYTIDIYRGEAQAQRNIIDFGAYVALFPQLIAGPIVRYQTIDNALKSRTHTLSRFERGATRFVVGLSKKVLLANNMGMLWDSASAAVMSGEGSILLAWLGIIAYAFQIYFDFSGYSDMAIGLGCALGFDFLENFNYPYISRSVTEFWRRWHISLGTWFREYVYIPLGGNRKGPARQTLNLLIVWAATGIWHGASWNFALWGLYYFALLVIEKRFLLKILDKIPRIFSHIYTLFAVLIGWVLFAFDSLPNVGLYLKAMFSGPLFSNLPLYLIMTTAPLLAICVLASLPIGLSTWRNLDVKKPTAMATVQAALMIIALFVTTAFLVDGTYNPFLYFRF